MEIQKLLLNRIDKAVLISILLFMTFMNACTDSQTRTEQAAGGILDLSRMDLKNTIVDIKGEFGFVFGKLVNPGENIGFGFINVPQAWSTQGYPIKGIGTYRLTIKLDKIYDILSLKIGELLSVYKLYINDKLLVEEDLDEKKNVRFKTDIVHFIPESNNLTLFFQVSNYQTVTPGIVDHLMIGVPENIYSLYNNERSVIIFLAGIIVFMLLYHFFLFVFRRFREKTDILFCVACIIGLIRILSRKAIIDIPPVLMTTSGIFFGMFLMLFFRQLLNYRFFNIAIIPYFAVSAIYVIAMWIDYYNADFLAPLNMGMCSVFSIVVSVLGIYTAIKRKEIYKLLYLLSPIIASFTAINNFFWGFGYPFYNALNEIGMTVMFLVISIVRAKHYSDTIQQKNELHHFKYESLGKLTAGISHQIINPLSNIYGPLQNLEANLLKNQMLDEKRQTYFRQIENGIKRINSIIRSLRTLNYGKEDFKDVKLCEILASILELYDDAVKKRIEFKLELDRDFEIYINPNALMNILMNIISNAVDAISGNGVILIKPARKKYDMIIEISDNGSGIKRENMQYIFDADFTTKEFGKGTGLGLYLVKQLIINMEWEIKIESEYGKGTSVFLIKKNYYIEKGGRFNGNTKSFI